MVAWGIYGGFVAWAVWSFIETRRRNFAVHAAAAANPEMTQVQKVDMAQQPLPQHWDGVALFTLLSTIAGALVVRILNIGFSDAAFF